MNNTLESSPPQEQQPQQDQQAAAVSALPMIIPINDVGTESADIIPSHGPASSSSSVSDEYEKHQETLESDNLTDKECDSTDVATIEKIQTDDYLGNDRPCCQDNDDGGDGGNEQQKDEMLDMMNLGGNEKNDDHPMDALCAQNHMYDDKKKDDEQDEKEQEQEEEVTHNEEEEKEEMIPEEEDGVDTNTVEEDATIAPVQEKNDTLQVPSQNEEMQMEADENLNGHHDPSKVQEADRPVNTEESQEETTKHSNMSNMTLDPHIEQDTPQKDSNDNDNHVAQETENENENDKKIHDQRDETLPSSSNHDNMLQTGTVSENYLNESILVELQASLQHQMTIRAEVEDKLRHQTAEIQSLQKKLLEQSGLQEQLEDMKAKLTESNAEKTQLEQEVTKLRDGRDDLERREAVLSNRLNDAKKKEANVSHVAGRLEAENEELQQSLTAAKEELQSVVAQKQKLEHSMEKLKKKCVERVKMAEAALLEEQNLNEERKKKMKVFVETKAEELRSAKSTADELRAELKETSGALESVRGKLERMTQQYENTSMKNRELTREINRMKKNSEQLHQLGGSLEMELQKSAQETEEHKNKRLTAKHELMTVLRKLEAEQAVNGKLKDSVKFTFTPKALSQQQLLQEGLEDFESELLKLSRRLGKPLPPSSYSAGMASQEQDTDNSSLKDNEEQTNADHAQKKKINSRSEWDTARLLSSLEHETQQVSKGIMAFMNAVERLHVLLDTSGEKSCVNTLNEIFGVLAAARVDALPFSTSTSSEDHAHAPSPSVVQIRSFEDEDGSFAGSPIAKKKSSERYGLVGTGES